MGRFPLTAAVNTYLEKRKLKVGQRTYANECRNLRGIANAIEGMREDGRIKTSHPKEIGPVEVRAFMDWMRDPKAHKGKPLDPDTQDRYLSKLEGVLKDNDNHVIERMRDEGYTFPQRIARKPIKALSKPDLEAVQYAAQGIKRATGEPEGWRRAKTRLLMTLYAATGLRPSELREVQMQDVDLRRWRIYVRSPKGGGVWAENRTITIMPQGRPELIDFLKEREQLLRYYGKDKAIYLIPNLKFGRDEPYSSNHFRELKKEVQEIAGIDFMLKDFRPTFASLTVEMDSNLLNDVSAQLGHSNTNTTQRYYAQISAESAGTRLVKAYESHGSTKTKEKGKGDGDVAQLLESLGYSSIEELRKHLDSKAESASNRGIDFKNPPAGYY